MDIGRQLNDNAEDYSVAIFYRQAILKGMQVINEAQEATGMVATQQQVNAALDNACANGYDIDLDKWSPEEIADDIVQYNADLEDTDPLDLIPFIRVWKQRRTEVK